MTPLFLASAVASAADPVRVEIPDHGVEIVRGDARISVRAVTVPKPSALFNKNRICPVTVSWTGGKVVSKVQESCHPNVAEGAAAAAAAWDIAVPTPPLHDQELFEYWFVFPAVPDGPVQVFLRQAWDEQLTLDSPAVGVLDFGISSRVMPEYPPQALTMDTTLTRCTARLLIQPSGVPADVRVSGCDDVFVGDLTELLRGWRFKGPTVDGVPFWTAVDLGFQFDKPLRDGDAGKVTVVMPPDPQGAAVVHETVAPPPEEPPPPPLPDWPPILTLNHKSYAEVRVYEIRWPESVPKLDHDATCDVLFGVNSERRVWAWAEACDEAVREPIEVAANRWILAPGKREKGEWYARFRATFVIPADGSHPYVRVPVDDVVAPALGALPEHVSTYRSPTLLTAVPPKLPKVFATEILEERVVCEYDVTVSPRGTAAAMVARTCPTQLSEYAEKALTKWRWTPAESDGKAIEAHVPVKIRFDLVSKSG
jgi:hypothetical protein